MGSRLQATRHVIEQLRDRCGVEVHKHELHTLEQTSEYLYGTPNGIARLVSIRGRPAVLILQGRTAVTAITLEMAFSDCPEAVFFSLVARGEVDLAIKLRIKKLRKQLPRPSDLSERHYKYSRGKARIVWSVFRWVDLHQR